MMKVSAEPALSRPDHSSNKVPAAKLQLKYKNPSLSVTVAAHDRPCRGLMLQRAAACYVCTAPHCMHRNPADREPLVHMYNDDMQHRGKEQHDKQRQMQHMPQ